MSLQWRRAIACIVLCLLMPLAQGASRPNFVWIVSEDNSMHYLRHFFPAGTATPHIESLAAAGLTFRHAYANAPVCGTARTTLSSGQYLPKIGGLHFRRDYRRPDTWFELPDGERMFQELLREAGYYTANNWKNDFTIARRASVLWDDSHPWASWDGGEKGQPFFYFVSLMETHESSTHFDRETFQQDVAQTPLDDLVIADYHPDTDLVRYTYARYLDAIRVVDDRVGEVVEELREAGVLEDTFVFYFSDHGGALPRGKRALYGSGLHVPLVVRIPANFRHLVGAEPGASVNGVVSFVDFAPTLLTLAGVEVPGYLDGEAFLGPQVTATRLASREASLGYSDRFDGQYMFKRSLTDARWHYVRHYQPYLPDSMMIAYREKALMMPEWRQLHRAGTLNTVQRQFFETRAPEELFDTANDPHHVNNLAGQPEHRAQLLAMRADLQQRLKALPDIGFYPESYLVTNATPDATRFAAKRRAQIATMIDTADLQLLPYAEAQPKLRRALASPDLWERYWAATVAASFGVEAKDLVDDVLPLIEDSYAGVRLRALEYFGRIGAGKPMPPLLSIANKSNDPIVVREALQSITYLRDYYDMEIGAEELHPLVADGYINRRLAYLTGEEQKNSLFASITEMWLARGQEFTVSWF